MTDRGWKWIGGALAWYCLMGALYIRTRPGFQYDEAIDVMGAVQMRHSHEELKLPHPPNTWTCVARHCFPLMSAEYIGSVKDYVCLPMFAVFGPRAEVERSMTMAFGAVGILGIAIFFARQAGYAIAAATAWVLALNPSYLDMTVFDNSGFSPLMAAFGLLCIAASGYLANRGARNAFWVGAAGGFGIWARANYVWMLVALAGAFLVAGWRHLRVPWSHGAAFVAGRVVGGLPFVVYQVFSGGGTWAAAGTLKDSITVWQRFEHRTWMMSDTLLSNGEHHQIWGGPGVPVWQLWLFGSTAAAGIVICLTTKAVLARVLALALLILAVIFCYSPLPISEHHIITMLPLAAAVVVLAAFEVRRMRVVLGAFAAVYVGSALYWQFAAWDGLRKTGGVGVWSDGMYTLVDRLRSDYPGCEIKILDWGLQNSIFVLSDAQVKTRETFWDATADHTNWNGIWAKEIEHGGIFLLNGPENRQIPAASIGFLRALDERRPSVKRSVILQRNGRVFAEVIEVMSPP